MAHSNLDSIEIKERVVYDGRKPLKIFELYVDGCRRATVEEQRHGEPRFRFDPVGAFAWQEVQVWLQGLLELSIIAEGLKHGTKKDK
jgi:hypothetical protein